MEGTVVLCHPFLERRKLNEDDKHQVPDQIRIVKDGDAIRMLGAWIGKKVDDVTTWEPILDKIHDNLQKWKNTHPTMDGRCTIVQAIVGGLTQFLTQA